MTKGADELTIDEAAALTGLGLSVIKNAIARKLLTLQPHRLKQAGRKSKALISRSDLQAWLASREANQAERQEVQERSRALREAREQRRQARPARDPAQRPGTNARCSRRSAAWGESLRAARERLCLTITELARRVDVCQSYVSRMEGLGEIPRRDKVLSLARALEVEPEPFFVLCGYATELTPVVQIAQSLLALPPDEQAQAAALFRQWREAPESVRHDLSASARRAG